MMKKTIPVMTGILLMGVLLTLGGCSWGPWHGHGLRSGAAGSYQHGPQDGYNHYDGCGHSRY